MFVIKTILLEAFIARALKRIKEKKETLTEYYDTLNSKAHRKDSNRLKNDLTGFYRFIDLETCLDLRFATFHN